MFKRIAIGLVALAGLLPALACAADCDRACLTGLVTSYVDALLAHKPAQLPVTPDVRFTENSAELALGDGLWKTVTGNSGFRQDYIDVRDQIAAAHLMLLQGKQPVLYSLVLHVRDRRIAGIETLVEIVKPDSHFQPQELGKPLPHFNDPVPAARKDSRGGHDPHRAGVPGRPAHRQLHGCADTFQQGSLPHRERRIYGRRGLPAPELRGHVHAEDHAASGRAGQRRRGGRGQRHRTAVAEFRRHWIIWTGQRADRPGSLQGVGRRDPCRQCVLQLSCPRPRSAAGHPWTRAMGPRRSAWR